jgi:hypothetical protein
VTKPQGKDTGREYTTAEMDYALSRVELFRQLERHPVLDFLKSKLVGRLTGPFTVPVRAELTSVRRAAQALFKVLRDSGFVLGAFEMEKVFKWDLDSWLHAIQVVLDPLTVLVGTVKTDAGPPPDPKREEPTQSAPLPTRYPSSVYSDSSVESPKRMPMSRPLPTKQPASKRESRPLPDKRPAGAARPVPTRQADAPAEGAIPKALEAAIIKLMQSTVLPDASRARAADARHAASARGGRHSHGVCEFALAVATQDTTLYSGRRTG